MTHIDDIIKESANPFDPTTIVSGNFWTDNHSSFPTVESIHQDNIVKIEKILDQVIKGNNTRSILLSSDRGSGRTYLLGRLKKQFNAKAFFAYIGPWPTNDHIWRHTLRYTVESLIHQPEGEKESQLLLWLKSLPVFKEQGIIKELLGEKQAFIKYFQKKYQAGIYQSHQFFTVLYELTQEDNYIWACDWLKGDNIAEDQMKALGVRTLIESEEAARGILANFGVLADATKPIVLCFDQVESGPKLPTGNRDISAPFHVNTTLYNNNLKNFLVIISITVHSLRQDKISVSQSDFSRIEEKILLETINLDQVEALWASRLYPLHIQAKPKPESPIYPLTREQIEERYKDRKKINLRDSLNLGGKLFQAYKDTIHDPDPVPPIEAFKDLWEHELKKTQNQVEKITRFSAHELIGMLSQALEVSGANQIKNKLVFSPTFASYSLSYVDPKNQNKVGIFWNENYNMNNFFWGMNACKNTINAKICDSFIFLREGTLPNPQTQGYKLYDELFLKSFNDRHLIPSLEDVHYLRTYQKLVNDAVAGDLSIDFEPVDLETLQKLTREYKVLEDCKLLQELWGIIPTPPPPPPPPPPEIRQHLKKEIENGQMVSKLTLLKNARYKFPEASKEIIENILDEICKTGFASVINPKSKLEEQVICWNPQHSTSK